MSENNNNLKYRYTVFGLKITSDILIQDLLTTEESGDISIEIGKVPDKIHNPVDYSEDYQISKTEFLFSIADVAKYYVKNGNEIIVEPFEDADNNAVNAYLMGTAMGTLLLQRGMIPIHGSCVVIDDRCVIFTGPSGAGKSSICSAFRKNGYKFLSDDISVITLGDDGSAMVQPAFPQQRLCRDTAEEMGIDLNSFNSVNMVDEKIVVNNNENFKNQPVYLSSIFNLSVNENCDVELKEVSGMEKLQSFIDNIYCNVILIRQGISPIFFRQCLEMVKKIKFYNLIRPIGIFTVNKQMELVINAHKVHMEE